MRKMAHLDRSERKGPPSRWNASAYLLLSSTSRSDPVSFLAQLSGSAHWCLAVYRERAAVPARKSVCVRQSTHAHTCTHSTDEYIPLPPRFPALLLKGRDPPLPLPHSPAPAFEEIGVDADEEAGDMLSTRPTPPPPPARLLSLYLVGHHRTRYSRL